jgi:hypothetical protein
LSATIGLFQSFVRAGMVRVVQTICRALPPSTNISKCHDIYMSKWAHIYMSCANGENFILVPFLLYSVWLKIFWKLCYLRIVLKSLKEVKEISYKVIFRNIFNYFLRQKIEFRSFGNWNGHFWRYHSLGILVTGSLPHIFKELWALVNVKNQKNCWILRSFFRTYAL